MNKTLKYISHGPLETGGYKHELFLYHTLKSTGNYEATSIRFRKNYRGLPAWCSLFMKAFSNANADVVVTVSRLIWPVVLRNLFRKNKIILVLHNHDPQDGKPKLFYSLLNSFLSGKLKRHPEKYKLIVISDYWKKYFERTFNIKDILVFPNFFNNIHYTFYRDIARKNQQLIHLGQWSEKIDRKRYLNLIFLLKQAGYIPYFSSAEKTGVLDFPVTYFPNREAYLKQMAMARASIVLNRVNEGWPRLVHESFLVGTQVLALAKGGLTELIETGNGYLLQNEQEVLPILALSELKEISYPDFDIFDETNAATFAPAITDWLHA